MQLKATKIPIGSHYLRCSSFNSSDVNTSVVNVYQIGPTSHRIRVLSDLMMLIAEEPIFTTLRTNEQLAYNVSCTLKYNHGILSYAISVNSQENKHSANYVDERIENFRHELLSIIDRMSDENFNEFKATLAEKKLQPDNKLPEEVAHNWITIRTDGYEFDRAPKEVECLATVTKTELLEFYRSHYGEQQRKLSVQVIGNSSGSNCVSNDISDENETEKNRQYKRFDSLCYVGFQNQTGSNVITNVMEFKNALEVYSVAKST